MAQSSAPLTNILLLTAFPQTFMGPFPNAAVTWEAVPQTSKAFYCTFAGRRKNICGQIPLIQVNIHLGWVVGLGHVGEVQGRIQSDQKHP